MAARLLQLVLLSSVMACTGAIGEPLPLGAEVEVGGWLVLDEGAKGSTLLQRVADIEGETRFVGSDGEPVGSIEFDAEAATSVYVLGPKSLWFLEEWGEARAPVMAELSLERADTRLGKCACPIPEIDDRVRFIDGATCVVSKARGRSVRWDGAAWAWSEGAAEDLRLHVGGEQCAPSVEELLSPEPLVRMRMAPPIVIPPSVPQAGTFKGLELVSEGRVLILDSNRSGILALANGETDWLPHALLESDAEWELLSLLRFGGAGVVAAVSSAIGGEDNTHISWLVREGKLQAPLRDSIVTGAVELAELRQLPNRASYTRLTLGPADELLLGSSTASVAPVRIGVMSGELEPWAELRATIVPAGSVTWLHLRQHAKLVLIAPDLEQSQLMHSHRLPDGALSRVSSRTSLAFPRPDVAATIEPRDPEGGWKLEVFHLEDEEWVTGEDIIASPSSGCGAIPSRAFFAIVNGKLRGLTSGGIEIGTDGECVANDLPSPAVDARWSPAEKRWIVLGEDGELSILQPELTPDLRGLEG